MMLIRLCLSRLVSLFFFFSSRRRHTRSDRDWSSDVCSSDLTSISLELRQIEVRARAAREKFLRVVEEEQAEVRQAGGYGMAIDPQVLLLEVPSSRSYEEGRDPVAQTIRAAVRRVVGDRPTNRVDEVHVTHDDVRPGRREGIFKIGHEHLRAR